MATTKRTDAPLPPVPAPPQDDNVLNNDWSCVKLLEEYNPNNVEVVSAPYAYVADYVVRVDVSVSIVEEMAKYEEIQRAGDGAMSGSSDETLGRAEHNKRVKEGGKSSSKAGWFEQLRDQLQRQEDIRWYIVVCGDEERDISGPDDYGNEEDPALDPWERKMRLMEVERQALVQQKEEDDHEKRRKALQMQLGKPADDDPDTDEYGEKPFGGDPWEAKMRLMEYEREEKKRREQQEKGKEKLKQFHAQSTSPPGVPEKDYPPRPGMGAVLKSKKSTDLGHSYGLGAKKSMDTGSHANSRGSSPKPKTRKGSLRRLFSRGRLVDDTRRGNGVDGMVKQSPG